MYPPRAGRRDEDAGGVAQCIDATSRAIVPTCVGYMYMYLLRYLLSAVPRPPSYGKMVPLRHPMVKTYPTQGSYISKVGEGAEVRWWSSRGYGFTIGCRRGTILP